MVSWPSYTELVGHLCQWLPSYIAPIPCLRVRDFPLWSYKDLISEHKVPQRSFIIHNIHTLSIHIHIYIYMIKWKHWEPNRLIAFMANLQNDVPIFALFSRIVSRLGDFKPPKHVSILVEATSLNAVTEFHIQWELSRTLAPYRLL